MRYAGQCHCGKLKASFETTKTPAALGLRECQCAFCRRHGARNISDPDGVVVIDCGGHDILRYRFALRTCDFLICKTCGVYVAAVTGKGEDKRSTLNAAGLAMADFLDLPLAPMDYGAETAQTRIARRFGKWTPTRFLDADLNESYYGPH
jgi:hypothetical protein